MVLPANSTLKGTLSAEFPELNRIAVVMPSCDRYGSLWPLSLEALERYWPGKPTATYLVANHRVYSRPGVQQLLVGEDLSWSDNLLTALTQVPHDYIFLALDDLVMLPGTQATRMNEALARAVREQWDYLRVNPLPPPRTADAQGLGLALAGEAYRSATVWSLWKKSILQAVLKSGENAWAFEKIGSARTDRFVQWWASANRNVPYVNLVTRGRLDPDALRRLKSVGLDTSDLEFPIMNSREYLRLQWGYFRSKALRLFPLSIRRTILNILARP